MSKIIAITNNKGGVAKTTTTLNLGAGLAKKGFKVLLIDADPQANLSSSFGIDDKTDNNLGNLLIDSKTWREVVHRCELPEGKSIDLIPGARQMIGVENILFSQHSREGKLKRIMQKNSVKETYDFIFIDCGPNLGILTTNALCACDEFIIPFQCEHFSYAGTATMLEYAMMFRHPDLNLNPNIELCGILITKYHENIRSKVMKELAEDVKNNQALSGKVFKTFIRTNVKLMESPREGMNVFDYAPDSNGAIDYENLTMEFLEKQEVR